MEDKTTVGLKQQREKRKRINRMKIGIILSIFIWMLVSMILFVTLLVKVFSLEKQIDTLAQNSVQSSQVSQQSYGNNAGLSSQEYDTDESLTDTEMVATTEALANTVEDQNNLAKEVDELKVYLTFDDGPSENTSEILDILAEYKVKATFFVIGKDDDESKALYQRIVKEGHTLGMHSYSHKYSVIYDSLDAFENDYSEIQNFLYDVTGVDCQYYRFPGGSSNQVSNLDMSEFIRCLNEQGVTYFDWNVSSGDATSQAYTADELVDNVLSDVVKYKTSVVLLHDSNTKKITVEALGPMIEALQKLGAEILPIDENTTVIQHIKADSVK